MMTMRSDEITNICLANDNQGRYKMAYRSKEDPAEKENGSILP